MPICNECLQPCACVLSDLLTFNGIIIEESEFGLLRVDGKGTPGDPFTISFPNSEEYRPLVGEIAFNSFSSSGADTIPSNGMVLIYQSPGNMFLNIFPVSGIQNIVQRTQSVLFIGATVEFAANATGQRTLSIRQEGGSTPIEVARAFCDGTSAQAHRLSASGIAFHAVTTEFIQPLTSPKYTVFSIVVRSETGGALTVNTLKFWTVSL